MTRYFGLQLDLQIMGSGLESTLSLTNWCFRWWMTCLGFLRMPPNICFPLNLRSVQMMGDFLAGILPLQPCSVPSPVCLAPERLVDPTTLGMHMWAWLWKWLGWPPTEVDHSTHGASKRLVRTYLVWVPRTTNWSTCLANKGCIGKWLPEYSYFPSSIPRRGEGAAVLVLGNLIIISFDLSMFKKSFETHPSVVVSQWNISSINQST